jgi:hypothetical protein
MGLSSAVFDIKVVLLQFLQPPCHLSFWIPEGEEPLREA